MNYQQLIFLPGFPGDIYPRIEHEIRVIDHVQKIAFEKNFNFLPICYPGIKNEAEFSFRETLTFSLQQVSQFPSKQITLVGQSWGGLLALLLSKTFEFRNILVITPFLLKPSEDQLKHLLSLYSIEFPDLIKRNKFESYISEVSEMFLELDKLSKKANDICAILNLEDEILNAEDLEKTLIRLHISSISKCKADHNFKYNQEGLETWLRDYL